MKAGSFVGHDRPLQRRALIHAQQPKAQERRPSTQQYDPRWERCMLLGLGVRRAASPHLTRRATAFSNFRASSHSPLGCPQTSTPTPTLQLVQQSALRPSPAASRPGLRHPEPGTAPTTATATAATTSAVATASHGLQRPTAAEPARHLPPNLTPSTPPCFQKPPPSPVPPPPAPTRTVPYDTTTPYGTAAPYGTTTSTPTTAPTGLTRRSVVGSAAAAAAAAALGPLVLTSSASAAAVAGRPPAEMGFAPRVVEFTLGNGLHFIVLPRRNAPVVSCHTYANVGAWNEAPGCTGMAHLLEHMAFKGTPRLGSVDFRREAPLLDALDEAFYELRDAKAAVASGGAGGSTPRISTLRSRLRSLQDQAAALAVPNAFGATLQRAGGVGLNATTSHDQTRYFVSLPSNKLELWVALEAERFRAPVFRELYSEKAVIEEERRLRVDNTPMGRYQQDFALASLGNNYRRPIIGFEDDFDAIGRREVQAFFDRFYGPANLTIAIVGDADPRAVRRMAERYWGDWTGPEGYQVLPRGTPLLSDNRGASGGGTAAAWWDGSEDPRPEAFLSGSRTSLRAPARSGPAALLGYYRPPMTSREGVVLEVLSDVLAGGRTSRLISELVLSGRALSASLVSAYPGELHAGLALVYGVPKDGDGPEAVAALLQSQLTAVAEGGVSAAELARVQRATRAGLLSAAQSNSAMAAALASYHVSSGSWRGLIDELDLVTQLRPGELRDLAQRLFHPDNCFTGYVLKA